MSDDRVRWRRVQEVLQRALEQTPEDRARFLRAACGGDDELRGEVESLLDADAQAGSFAEPPRLDHLASALPARSTFGRYQILDQIGAGGMGEVYRARDLKLGRDVALKVLPRVLADDPDRVARLEREARVLGALNHPHIATIYGLEEGPAEDGRHVRALALELVQGPTLADRIARGAFRLEEALRIAGETAEALAAAHEKGIIHRDLKPANVKLTESGEVKVLDFGLAKLMSSSCVPVDGRGTGRPMPSTVEGVLTGTPAYMSPEQARGQAADERSDIWALGCMLYELLTGRAAFPGETITDVLAHVIDRDPDWAPLPEDTPTAVRHLLRRCLAKDPDRRFHDARDVRLDIEDSLIAPSDAVVRTHGFVSRRRMIHVAAGAAVATMGATAVIWTLAWPTTIEPAVTRFSVQPPPMPNAMALAVSPDGRTIAFAAASSEGRSMLFLKTAGSFEAQVLPGTEGAVAPFWSPDGLHIGFASPLDRKLKVVAVAGGQPRIVCDYMRPSEDLAFAGASWGRGGVIVFSTGGSLYRDRLPGTGATLHRVLAAGGVPAPLGALDRASGETAQAWPFFLPDGRRFLYLSLSPERSKRALAVGSLDSSDWIRLMPAESMAVYADSGYLLFIAQQRLLAQRFDPATLARAGDPVAIADGVLFGEDGGRGAFSAAGGTLAYRSAEPGRSGDVSYSLAWMDRQGKNAGAITVSLNRPSVRLSPNGTRIAMTDSQPETGDDIWTYDIERNRRTLFAGTAATEHLALWSPDGARIAFDQGSGDEWGHVLYEQRADRAEAPRMLIRPEPGFGYALLDWTSRYLVFSRRREVGTAEIWAQPMRDGKLVGEPRLYLSGLPTGTNAALSPNGRWLAYVDDQRGTKELTVQSFPDWTRSRTAVAIDGVHPRWSADGRELFFFDFNRGVLFAVPVVTDGAFRFETPVQLLTPPLGQTPFVEGPAAPYDVSGDGQRFLFAQRSADPLTPIRVVMNWTADLGP